MCCSIFPLKAADTFGAYSVDTLRMRNFRHLSGLTGARSQLQSAAANLSLAHLPEALKTRCDSGEDAEPESQLLVIVLASHVSLHLGTISA